MPYHAVLFDLDGTLLDTLADIAESADAVLRQFGFPTHGPAAYRRFVGDGVRTLFAQALPADRVEPRLLAECGTAFLEAYEHNWNRATKPYEGIGDLLDALGARRIKLAVLSNKPDRFTKLCVGAYFAGRDFQAVLGSREGCERKPDPCGAREIARLLALEPDAFAYVGDTPTDMETARRAGMFPVGVTWGFRPESEIVAAGAAVVIRRPLDLLDVIQPAPRQRGTV